MFHSTEASIAAVRILVAIGLALMQIGSVNIILTSTPKQFSGISLGMNLLIYLIGASVARVIAGVYLQANQIFVKSEITSISASFPSPLSYNLIFLTAALISAASIAFAIALNRISLLYWRTDISHTYILQQSVLVHMIQVGCEA